MEQPGSVTALLDGYRLDNVDIKVPCAAALLKLGHPGPASEMLSTLTRSLDNPDGGLRREALENISALETPAALPVLTRCLNDSNGDVRLEAVTGLRMLGLPEVLPLLERTLQDPNPNVVEEARRALEELKKPKEKKSP
jgi:HEAT repeat protein